MEYFETLHPLYGRKTIYTPYSEISTGNVTDVLQQAVAVHAGNATEEKYLYEVYKGKQDIIYKEKDVRPEINHKITENRAFQITNFWTGTMAGDPIIYTSVNADEESVKKIEIVKRIFKNTGKDALNKELFDWANNTGHGYLAIVSGDRAKPFECYVLEPEKTFVVYHSGMGHRPVMGVYITADEQKRNVYNVYTTREYFKIIDGMIVENVLHPYGDVPIIEYSLNSAKLGIFEPAISILNAINYLDSDRMDAVTQYVNSLMVLYNAQLPDGEDGNTVRQRGLIMLKSTNDSKSDIKILSEQLDQTQNQTLKDDMYNSVLQIVGMPSTAKGDVSDSSNNGAAWIRSGFQITEMRAKGMEEMFKISDKRLLKIALKICRDLLGIDIDIADIDIKFTRHTYSDIVSKSNVLATLHNDAKCNPLDAWVISELVTDPEAAYKRGMEWYETQKDEESNTKVSEQV